MHVLLYSVTVPSHQEGAWSVEVLRSWLLQLPERPPLKAAGWSDHFLGGEGRGGVGWRRQTNFDDLLFYVLDIVRFRVVFLKQVIKGSCNLLSVLTQSWPNTVPTTPGLNFQCKGHWVFCWNDNMGRVLQKRRQSLERAGCKPLKGLTSELSCNVSDLPANTSGGLESKCASVQTHRSKQVSGPKCWDSPVTFTWQTQANFFFYSEKK